MMRNKLLLSFCLVLCLGLAMPVNAAQRMVVCEEAYSEG